jgi:Pyruvate/2-oxoacid:ferredoxin oxidoreductase gamma subunit
MTPSRSKQWVKKVLADYFPLGVKKDVSEEFERKDLSRPVVKNSDLHDVLNLKTAKVDPEKIAPYREKTINEEIKVTGFGGQGVLSLGTVLSEMGMRHDYQVSWLPSYGPEMRGGTANCSVKISQKKIGSPLVANPTILIAMNRPSLDKFEHDVISGGLIIYDDSLIDRKPVRDDVEVIAIPATKLADELGNTKAANMIIVGALIEYKDLMSQEVVLGSLGDVLKRKNLVEMNQKAILRGAEFIKNLKK